MAGSLEVGDERRQGRSDQATALDGRRQWGLVHLVAVRAPAGMTAMLLDEQGHHADIDLLDHPWRQAGGGLEAVTTAGAGVDAMVEGAGVDGFGGKGDAFVFAMTGLSADASFVLSLRWRGLGRLDEVGGGWLGGGGRVFASGGELLDQLVDDRLDCGQFRLQGINSRLKPKTVGAGSRVGETHGDRS